MSIHTALFTKKEWNTYRKVITGVVALLSWATPIVRDAAKKELGELVKLAIKRIISRYVPFSASPIELSVTPQSNTSDRTSMRIFAGDKIGAMTALFVITGLSYSSW
jgi:hypothetical protein